MRNRKKHFTTKNTHSRSGMGKNKNVPLNQHKERYSIIKEPTSVEEFRKNLTRYYFSMGNEIYTQELGYVNVNELECIQDLVDKIESEGYTTLNLTPKVIELEKWEKYVKKNQIFTDVFNPDMFYERFWNSDDTHIIIPNNMEFMEKCPTIMGGIYWKNILQTKELYQFYHNKVMGEYGLIPDFNETKKIIYSII
jgi:hypothetical protein